LSADATRLILKSEESIRDQLFCSFLALCLKRELEMRMEEKGLEAEWAEVVRWSGQTSNSRASPPRQPLPFAQ